MTGRHAISRSRGNSLIAAWLAVHVWLQGRHALWAVLAVCFSTLASLMFITLCHGDLYKVVVYASQACAPDSGVKAPVAGSGAAYIGCPSGTSGVPLLVSIPELLLVVGIVAAVVLLAPAMHTWELFARRRLVSWYAVSVGIAVALPLAVFLFTAHVGVLHMPGAEATGVTANALFDVTLMLLAMVLFGRFWGLWFGLLLLFANIKTQTWQLKLGFAFHVYGVKMALGLPNQTLTIWVAGVLAVVSVLLWALRRGVALLIREG